MMIMIKYTIEVHKSFQTIFYVSAKNTDSSGRQPNRVVEKLEKVTLGRKIVRTWNDRS